jgi:hypothetical protein
MSACDHPGFKAQVRCGRLCNERGVVTRYTAEVQVHCNQCGVAFEFVGLPIGVDLDGATVSADGLEARLAIVPAEAPQPPLKASND